MTAPAPVKVLVAGRYRQADVLRVARGGLLVQVRYHDMPWGAGFSARQAVPWRRVRRQDREELGRPLVVKALADALVGVAGTKRGRAA